MSNVVGKDNVNPLGAGGTYGSLAEFGGDTNTLTDPGGEEVRAECLKQLEQIRVIILVVALSVHGLFEGLAMGLQSKNSAVWSLFLAIATHKSVISFSTGLQIAKTYSPLLRPVVISICVYSIMSPLGGAIGTLIISIIYKHDGTTLDLMNAILQSVAAGTFIYITFFEILGKSLSGRGYFGLVRVCAVIVGFSIMASLALLH